jgi:hypothetical protein
LDDDHWLTGLNLTAEDAAAFRALAEGMGSSPPEILKKMVAHVLEVDRHLGNYGLRGLPGWITREQSVDRLLDHVIDGLPIDIRPTGCMWPADKAFPWSAEECKAAVIGYAVKWNGDFDDLWNHLRGKWEVSGGYAFLHQS